MQTMHRCSVTWSLRSSFLFIVLLLLSASHVSIASEDMWESVFVFQEKMAGYGNPEAQYKLGEMYEEGRGTEQNFDKALEWYQKAAAQGNVAASNSIERIKLRKQSISTADHGSQE